MWCMHAYLVKAPRPFILLMAQTLFAEKQNKTKRYLREHRLQKSPHSHSAVLLPDVCQGCVVDKHHAGQVEGHTEILHQRLHRLDPCHVTIFTQSLNQSGDGELRGHLVRRQHGFKFLKSICGGVPEVSTCVYETTVYVYLVEHVTFSPLVWPFLPWVMMSKLAAMSLSWKPGTWDAALRETQSTFYWFGIKLLLISWLFFIFYEESGVELFCLFDCLFVW